MDLTDPAIAPESPKTMRAREKLMRQFADEKSKITPAALKETVEKIHDWIANNAKHRVEVQKSGMHLFSQNKDVVDMSRKVAEVARNLSSSLFQMEGKS